MLIQTSLLVAFASSTTYSQAAPAVAPEGVVCCSALVGRIRSDHTACGLSLVARMSIMRKAEKYLSLARKVWLNSSADWWLGRISLTFLTPPSWPVKESQR